MTTASRTTDTLACGYALPWRMASVAMLMLLLALSTTLDATSDTVYNLCVATSHNGYLVLQLALSLIISLGFAVGVVGLIRESPRLFLVACLTSLFHFISMLTLVAISMVSMRKTLATKVKESWVTSGYYVLKLLIQPIAIWIYSKTYRHLCAASAHNSNSAPTKKACVPGL